MRIVNDAYTSRRDQVRIIAGVRRVHDLGPKGGERRRFQVWIERRDDARWSADASHIDHCYGEIFNRQWEAAQAARFAAEQCRAVETIFRAFTGSSA